MRKFLRWAVPVLISMSQFLGAADVRMLGFVRIAGDAFRPTLFNPENFCADFLGWTAEPVLDLRQFLSFDFEGLSLHWRADITGSAEFADGRGGESDFLVNQFFFQKELTENLVLIAGRIIQRWGTGYAFNPADIVAPDKDLADPNNTEKRAVGNDMIMLEYYGLSFSLAACALTHTEIRNGLRLRNGRLALRFYKNIGQVDLSILTLFQNREMPVWAGSFAGVIGERLEIHGEARFQKSEAGVSTVYDHEILLGFQITLPGDFFLVSEYIYRSRGLSRKAWNRALDTSVSFTGMLNGPSAEAAAAGLLQNLNVFSPQGAMRHYLMIYLSSPSFRRLTAQSTCLLNPVDRSFVLIPALGWWVGKSFTFHVRNYIFLGKGKSEFGEFFQSNRWEFGLWVRL